MTFCCLRHRSQSLPTTQQCSVWPSAAGLLMNRSAVWGWDEQTDITVLVCICSTCDRALCGHLKLLVPVCVCVFSYRSTLHNQVIVTSHVWLCVCVFVCVSPHVIYCKCTCPINLFHSNQHLRVISHPLGQFHDNTQGSFVLLCFNSHCNATFTLTVK